MRIMAARSEHARGGDTARPLRWILLGAAAALACGAACPPGGACRAGRAEVEQGEQASLLQVQRSPAPPPGAAPPPAACADAAAQAAASSPADWAALAAFRQAQGRTYDDCEAVQRLPLFQAELAAVRTLNEQNVAGGGDAAFGLNGLSDRTPEEKPARGYASSSSTRAPRTTAQVSTAFAGAVLPEFIDWRRAGVVTPVKNQAGCGSCWAHSATESVESAYALWVNGPTGLQTLSVQQVLSCTPPVPPNGGCGGLSAPAAFEYLAGDPIARALVLEQLWPYDVLTQVRSVPSNTTPCQPPMGPAYEHGSAYESLLREPTEEALSPTVAQLEPMLRENSWNLGSPVQVVDYLEASPGADLDTLARSLVLFGPISINVNTTSWERYSKGRMTLATCPAGPTDHVVQLVGYNRTGPAPYWIVRNQWLTNWGMDGYAHLAYGENTCNLALGSSVPLVKGMEEKINDPPEWFSSAFLLATAGTQTYEATVSR